MSEETPKKSNTGLIIGIGCAVLIVGTFVIGIVAAIAIPNFVSMQYKTKRSEIPMNMKAIKTMQVAYRQNFDVYVPAAAYPRTPSKEAQAWVVSESGGFQTLGWQPDGAVRGSYSVTTTANDFEIIGLSDIDGDGVYATYRATSSANPVAITPIDVY